MRCDTTAQKAMLYNLDEYNFDNVSAIIAKQLLAYFSSSSLTKYMYIYLIGSKLNIPSLT